jgi:hypothetical protein
MRIAYFTAGTHGAGHIVRGNAIGAALARQQIPHEFRIFSPDNRWNYLADVPVCPTQIQADLLRDGRTADSSDVALALRAWQPDLLLIDLFWVPLSLVALPCPAWLLLRSVPSAWLVGPSEARFSPQRYERVFAIEPAPGLESFEAIPPIVYEKIWLPRTREELCDRLSLDVQKPLRLIVQAGLPSDDEMLQNEADRQGGGFVRVLPELLTPASPWLQTLRDDDRVIAGAGYNLYWESHYFGFLEHMHFVGLPRRIDDQAWRASLHQHATAPTQNGADVLASQITQQFV